MKKMKVKAMNKAIDNIVEQAPTVIKKKKKVHRSLPPRGMKTSEEHQKTDFLPTIEAPIIPASSSLAQTPVAVVLLPKS